MAVIKFKACRALLLGESARLPVGDKAGFCLKQTDIVPNNAGFHFPLVWVIWTFRQGTLLLCTNHAHWFDVTFLNAVPKHQSCATILRLVKYIAWPKKKLSFHFESAEFLNVLNDQVIPSMGLLFPDGSGVFQDDNAKIHLALVVKEWSMRTHECQGAWGVIFTLELATTESWLYPIKSLWDVLEKTEGVVWLPCHQYKISVKNECNSGWK